MTENMTNQPNPLHDADFMRALLDLVIPPTADGKRPGAGSLGLEPGLASDIQGDPRLGPLVTAGLQSVREAAVGRDPGGFVKLSPQARREVVDAAIAEHPALMIGLSRHLYLAYYQHPRVLEGLGEPPRPPFPEGYSVDPTDSALMEALQQRRKEE